MKEEKYSHSFHSSSPQSRPPPPRCPDNNPHRDRAGFSFTSLPTQSFISLRSSSLALLRRVYSVVDIEMDGPGIVSPAITREDNFSPLPPKNHSSHRDGVSRPLNDLLDHISVASRSQSLSGSQAVNPRCSDRISPYAMRDAVFKLQGQSLPCAYL